jgi:hypothetical protein
MADATLALFTEVTGIPDEENEFILEYGEQRFSSLLRNNFSPFAAAWRKVDWSGGMSTGRALPDIAKKHVYRWLTDCKENTVDNAIAFAHAYPGMLVCCNGSWFEFVGPHYKCHGKKFGDIESSLQLILTHHFYTDMVVPVWKLFKDQHPAKDTQQWFIKRHCEEKKNSFKNKPYKSFFELVTYLYKPDSWVSFLGTKTYLLPFADNKVSRGRAALL